MIIPYRQDPFYVHKLKVAGDLGQVLFVPIDVRNEESLNKAVKYSNGVINLISEEWQSKNFTFHDINVEGGELKTGPYIQQHPSRTGGRGR